MPTRIYEYQRKYVVANPDGSDRIKTYTQRQKKNVKGIRYNKRKSTQKKKPLPRIPEANRKQMKPLPKIPKKKKPLPRIPEANRKPSKPLPKIPADKKLIRKGEELTPEIQRAIRISYPRNKNKADPIKSVQKYIKSTRRGKIVSRDQIKGVLLKAGKM